MNNTPLRVLFAATLITVGGTSRAQDVSQTVAEEIQSGLGLSEVAVEAVRNNPTLRASMIDLQKAQQDIRGQQSRYVPWLTLDASASALTNPQLNIVGGTTKSQQQSVVLGAEINQTLSLGTRVGFRVEGDSNASRSPFAGSSNLIEVGPGYGLLGRLTVAQPLMRGFGNAVGQAELRQALLSQTGFLRVRDATASQVLRDVIEAYWELWYAQEGVAIESRAQAFAVEQLLEAQKRIAIGAAAPADVYNFETRIAELDQSVLAADVLVQQRIVGLDRLLGRPQFENLSTWATTTGPPRIEAPVAASVIERAREASYDVLQQQVSVLQARDRLLTSTESTRPRLDVQGYVQARGLGNVALEPIAEQLGTLDNVSGNIAVVFEVPLWWAQNDAQSRAARFAISSAEQRMRGALVLVEATVASQIITLEEALKRIAISTRLAAVSLKNVDAQRKRYENGTAILLEVYDSENKLRRALLSVIRARVDAAIGEVKLEHLQGALLPAYAALVADDLVAPEMR